MGLLSGVAAEGGVVGGLVGIPGQGNTRNHLLACQPLCPSDRTSCPSQSLLPNLGEALGKQGLGEKPGETFPSEADPR